MKYVFSQLDVYLYNIVSSNRPKVALRIRIKEMKTMESC